MSCLTVKYDSSANRSSEASLNLIPVAKSSNGPLDYGFTLESSIPFPGGHGEEIVRDLFTDVNVCHPIHPHVFPTSTNSHYQTQTTFTCGEDGHIRAWKDASPADASKDVETKKEKKDRKEKKKDKKEKRFKPY
jgi:hypothetical protein